MKLMTMGGSNVPIWGNIMQFIAELIPGEQPGMGEMPGGLQGLLAPLAGLAELIPGTQSFMGEVRPAPAEFGTVVKAWSNGQTTFFMNYQRRIGCWRRDGTWKSWRPARHIVIPYNPRIGTLLRAHKRVNKMVDQVGRRAGTRRRRATPQISGADIKALIPLLTAGR